jgi:SAM-dependent methyltransferase
VLWRAGLAQETITPLHLTPAQMSSRYPDRSRPFSFCFVRHPLAWLASVWLHEMEFSWEPSEVTHRAGADVFATFLERMLAAWPEGPCWLQVSPFVEACSFVGRTESLAADLDAALTAASEVYDPACLTTPNINESVVPRLREAAKAPRDLLEAIMNVERGNFERFGYADIPDWLVAEDRPADALPRFPAKAQADVGGLEEAGRLGLLTPTYEYRLETGGEIGGDRGQRRLQWGILAALESAPRRGRCLVIHQSDPYFAYAARDAGFEDVTFACASRDLVSPRLQSVIDADIAIIDLPEVGIADDGAYDLIVMSGGLDISPLPEFELLRAERLLKPGGRLIFAAPILRLDDPATALKTLWPPVSGHAGRKLAYSTLGYLNRMLGILGFSPGHIEDQFGEAPHPDLRAEVDALAAEFNVDPDRLLAYMVISTTLEDRSAQQTAEQRRLAALWLSRLPVTVQETSTDWMPALAQTTISTLIEELKVERARRERAEQGLIDREKDLALARTDLAVHMVDVAYHREQARQAQIVADEAVASYRALLKRMAIATA